MQEKKILNGVHMIRIEDEIFLKKKFDFEKLKEFGFCFENNCELSNRIEKIYSEKLS